MAKVNFVSQHEDVDQLPDVSAHAGERRACVGREGPGCLVLSTHFFWWYDDSGFFCPAMNLVRMLASSFSTRFTSDSLSWQERMSEMNTVRPRMFCREWKAGGPV